MKTSLVRMKQLIRTGRRPWFRSAEGEGKFRASRVRWGGETDFSRVLSVLEEGKVVASGVLLDSEALRGLHRTQSIARRHRPACTRRGHHPEYREMAWSNFVSHGLKTLNMRDDDGFSVADPALLEGLTRG